MAEDVTFQADPQDSPSDNGIRLNSDQIMQIINAAHASTPPKAPAQRSPFQAQQPTPTAAQQPMQAPKTQDAASGAMMSPEGAERLNFFRNAGAATQGQLTSGPRASQQQQAQPGAQGATMTLADADASLRKNNPKATNKEIGDTLLLMAKTGAFKPKTDAKLPPQASEIQAIMKNTGKSYDDAANEYLRRKRAGPEEAGAVTTAKKEAEGAVKTELAQPKAAAAMESMKYGVKNTIDFIDMARKAVSGKTTGAGAYLANVKGTDAYNLSKTLDTIKSNIGFDKLQEMRTQSPTGSALGRVTNFEMQTLQNVVASLDQGQTEDQLNLHLDIAEKIMKHINDAIKEDYDRQYSKGAKSAPAQDTTALKTINFADLPD